MANSVDRDQTAPIGAVCSGSTLIASILTVSHFSYAPLIKCKITRIINVIYLF